MELIHLNESNFNAEVLEEKGPVVVDFYADWCGPCKQLAPIIEELAGEGVCKVGKLNIDQSPDVAARYSVMSIPTVILFQNGEAVRRTVGFRSKEALKKELQL